MDEYAIRRYVATSQQANHDSPENVENLQRKSHHKMTGHTTVYNLQCAPVFHIMQAYSYDIQQPAITTMTVRLAFVNGKDMWHRSSVGFTFVFSPWQSFQASLSSAHLA